MMKTGPGKKISNSLDSVLNAFRERAELDRIEFIDADGGFEEIHHYTPGFTGPKLPEDFYRDQFKIFLLFIPKIKLFPFLKAEDITKVEYFTNEYSHKGRKISASGQFL